MSSFTNYILDISVWLNSYWNLPFLKIYEALSNQKLILNYKLKSLIYNYKNIHFKNLLFKNLFMFYSFKSIKKNSQRNIFFKNKRLRFFRIIKYDNNFIFYLIFNKYSHVFNFFTSFFLTNNFNTKSFLTYWHNIYKKTFREGFVYIRGLFIIFFIDASFTDDEPLWEPLEWSLVQTWIFFIFIFAWIAENLITSRYGSYTGRDKRVWFAWYKSFWLLEVWYALSYGSAALFVIVPFYWELTYNISFVFSWWNWYTRIFFFKFISLYTIILFIGYFFQLNIRWLNWKKLFVMVLLINFFLGYLLYTNFIISFFGYFTDPLWYQKTRFVDYIQLSHDPLKWGWGPAKRDHFTYHKVSTVFWFKNDGPFAVLF